MRDPISHTKIDSTESVAKRPAGSEQPQANLMVPGSIPIQLVKPSEMPPGRTDDVSHASRHIGSSNVQGPSSHQNRKTLPKRKGRVEGNSIRNTIQSMSKPDRAWVPPTPSVSSRVFLIGWIFILMGYGIIGRGFANLGFAPVYIGEVVLSIGLIALVSSRSLGRLFAYPVSKILLAFLIWSLMMTLPHIPQYGVFALRDGVLWGYSVFGLIVASIIVSSPPVFRWILLRYRTFSIVFLALAWLMFVIMTSQVAKGFKLPGSSIDFFESKGGDLLVHLSGIAAFIAVGMSRNRLVFVPLLLFNLGILLISKRAGMLAFGAAFGLLLLLNPPKMKLSAIVFACTLSITAVLLINPKVDLGYGRVISVEQLTDNVVSTFDNSASSKLETTKSWRLDWWSDIIGYTFGGKYFLFGKGYGINLANDDGYQVLGDDALRSPHNAHMNILARSGVIGFGLWLAVHLTWFFTLLKYCLEARRRSMHNWHGIFSFLLAYWLAFMVNASFDVFLEGPMGGIWLWSVIGFGIGAVHLYKTQPEMGLDQIPVVIRRHVLSREGAKG